MYRDENIIVTRRPDGSIALIAWNLVMEKGEGFTKHVEIELPMEYKDVFIKRQTIDENYGNPWKVWKQLGRPRFPGKEEVNTLKHAAQPKLVTDRNKRKMGPLNLSITLTKNEVTLMEITPVKDETESYIDLDDSLIDSYSKEWS